MHLIILLFFCIKILIMKKIVYILSSIILTINCSAQIPNISWVKSMGGISSDISNAIVTDASGNIYTTGLFNGTADFDPGAAIYTLSSAGNSDIFVSKIDASGNFVWAVQIGGTGADVGNGIVKDASGNIYVTGSFSSTVDFDPSAGTNTLTANGGLDVFVLKLNMSGAFVWAKQIGGAGGDEGKSIIVDATGNVHTTGYFSGTADFDPSSTNVNLISNGSFDVFVSKLDVSGNLVWAKKMGGANNEMGNCISIDASSNVFTTGFFGGSGDFDPGASTFSLTSVGAGDAFISKLDVSGNFVWAKQLGGTANDVGNAIATDATGNVYSAGYFFTGGDFDPSASTFSLTSKGVGDIYVSKLDPSGNFLWAKGMGGPKDDFAHALAVDFSGNVYTTGFFADTVDFNPGAGAFTLVSVFPSNPSLIRDQAFISKLDASGNFVWAGALGAIKGYGIFATATDIYTTGYYTSTTDFDPSAAIVNLTTAGADDIYVHKMSQTGSVGLTESNIQTTITVFPNPTTGNFCVSNNEIPDAIIITNELGSEVMRIKPISTKEYIDMSEVANGIYYLITITNEVQQVTKLVLNK